MLASLQFSAHAQHGEKAVGILADIIAKIIQE